MIKIYSYFKLKREFGLGVINCRFICLNLEKGNLFYFWKTKKLLLNDKNPMKSILCIGKLSKLSYS